MLSIGERIKARRKELGMTQDELAQKTGYKSRSSINKIERGGNDLPQTKIISFANALETTPSELIGWEELWDEEAERVSQHFERLDANLKEYLANMFSDENDMQIAFEMIQELSRLNSDGLQELKKRQEELCRLDEYRNFEIYITGSGD